MDHSIYPLVPVRVPHSLLTKAGFDKSGRGGGRGGGCKAKGGRAPRIFELKLCDLVHIFLPILIENLLIHFFLLC